MLAGNTNPMFKAMADFMYPVGSYYITESSDLSTVTKMNAYFGGTWVKVVNRFLYGANTAGQEGGEASHTLSVAEIASHNHRLLTYTGHTRNEIGNNYSPDSSSANLGKYWGVVGNGSGSGSGTGSFVNNGDDGTQQTSASPACGYSNKARYGGKNINTLDIIEAKGNSQPHNNMPPYRTVYIYRRTALSGGLRLSLTYIFFNSRRNVYVSK